MKEFIDSDGNRWRARCVSHGATSEYLNRRVHRPIIQFSCLDARVPRRYAGAPFKYDQDLEKLADAELQRLLQRASVH